MRLVAAARQPTPDTCAERRAAECPLDEAGMQTENACGMNSSKKAYQHSSNRLGGVLVFTGAPIYGNALWKCSAH